MLQQKVYVKLKRSYYKKLTMMKVLLSQAIDWINKYWFSLVASNGWKDLMALLCLTATYRTRAITTRLWLQTAHEY